MNAAFMGKRVAADDGLVALHLDAGDLPYLVIQTFDVLHIHRRPHFDPSVQDELNVFPTLYAFGARNVRVSQFVNQRHAWLAP